MKNRLLLSLALIVLSQSLPALRVAAQNDGDQIVDGIGETALVARYQLAGDAQDRSRNSHHASLHGAGATFVTDDKFGQVLSLSGDGAFVQLPGETLEGEATVSVTAWVFLRANTSGQRVFDFGQNAASDFYTIATGDHAGARISAGGNAGDQGLSAAAIPANTWVHLAVVLDTTRKTLTAYVDGAKVAQADNVAAHLDQVLKQDAAANHLYLGKSQSDSDPSLNAKLHDVRIYRTALTDQQIATIRNNAWSGNSTVAANASANAEGKPAEAKSQTLESRIVAVSDVSVETDEGFLPRLPYTVPATYRDGKPGPEARVIWPSPTNNAEALKTGTFTVTGKVPGTELMAKATVTVKPAVAPAPGPTRGLEPFPLGQVILNQDTQQRDTQFMKNRDKFIRGLAESNPDRFLWDFRNAFGQPQPEGTRALGGWDSPTTRLRGHATGHYLSALAQCYASTTYDESLQTNFLQKMNYMIDTLYDLSMKSGTPTNEGGPSVTDPLAVPTGPDRTNYTSDLSLNGIRTDYWNWGKGFISAYPPDQFIMLEHGASYGSRNNQIWAPYYTLHKILAGLLDCYEVGGNKKALVIAQNMGTWVYQRLKVLPPATRMGMWRRYIAGEYGGMNEVLARLYRLTGDQQYMECAKLFDNTEFFFGDADHTHGLAKNVDTLRGKHANQHIPQITGALETYRDTKEVPYYEVADNFWDICTHDYMYSIGGVAGAKTPNNAECFTAEPDSLSVDGFNQGGQNETCATYNMLKLSRQLFMFDQDAKYMDYYEQALYNDILASVDEDNPGNTYHIPLNPGAQKSFGNRNMSGFTCCNGTALESNTKLQDSIYFHSADNRALYVNLYVPSTLTWPERKVVIKQVTSFPYADSTRISVNGSGDFDIKVRVPDWTVKGFTVKINGQEQSVKATPGTYLTLHRAWKDNDTIELAMPFQFHLSHVMDKPELASIFYGPILLAAQESGPLPTWRAVTLDADDLGKSITGDPAALHFAIGDVQLKPFYESYGNYSVYFNVALK